MTEFFELTQQPQPPPPSPDYVDPASLVGVKQVISQHEQGNMQYKYQLPAFQEIKSGLEIPNNIISYLNNSILFFVELIIV